MHLILVPSLLLPLHLAHPIQPRLLRFLFRCQLTMVPDPDLCFAQGVPGPAFVSGRKACALASGRSEMDKKDGQDQIANL